MATAEAPLFNRPKPLDTDRFVPLIVGYLTEHLKPAQGWVESHDEVHGTRNHIVAKITMRATGDKPTYYQTRSLLPPFKTNHIDLTQLFKPEVPVVPPDRKTTDLGRYASVTPDYIWPFLTPRLQPFENTPKGSTRWYLDTIHLNPSEYVNGMWLTPREQADEFVARVSFFDAATIVQRWINANLKAHNDDYDRARQRMQQFNPGSPPLDHDLNARVRRDPQWQSLMAIRAVVHSLPTQP